MTWTNSTGSPAPEPASDADALPDPAVDAVMLDRAVDLTAGNVADGGGPFGALVVEGGVVLAEGVNRVTRDNDPTAHAEVQAIRASCAARASFQLSGAVLYSSCEPCPMCLATALWARVDRVVYAGDRHDAARGGFDDLAFYELFATPREGWAMTVTHHASPGRTRPFDAWLADPSRTAY